MGQFLLSIVLSLLSIRIPRVKFTAWQSEALQKAFQQNSRPSNKEKAEIATRQGRSFKVFKVRP